MSCYSSVNDLLRKIDKTGSVERKVGSGRPSSIRTQRNISRVNDLICSQEVNPGTSKSHREIEKITGISCSSVKRIAMRDLRLNVFECAPAGRVLTNRSSTSPLSSGVTDWRQYSSELWTHWTVVLNIWFICCVMLCCVAWVVYAEHSCVLPLCIERYRGPVTKSKSNK